MHDANIRDPFPPSTHGAKEVSGRGKESSKEGSQETCQEEGEEVTSAED
jgi:hypothetical protein